MGHWVVKRKSRHLIGGGAVHFYAILFLMKLIFAQGNPGTQYTHTRHNIGFALLERYANEHESEFSQKNKFHANIAEITLNNEKVLLVKPTTYYNETGRAARALIDFYKLDPAHDFIVIYDDLALPFGTIRTREKGSSAGNNGIKSLNAALGENYKRIRVGIYNPLRDHIPAADFVLAPFTTNEKNAISDVYTIVSGFINSFIGNTFTSTKQSL